MADHDVQYEPDDALEMEGGDDAAMRFDPDRDEALQTPAETVDLHALFGKACGEDPTEVRVRALKQYFINRDDTFAFRAPWGQPCRGTLASDEDGDDLLRSHLLGSEAPKAVTVIYETKKGRQRATDYFRVGAYCIAKDGTSKWLCIDIDGPGHASSVADPDGTAMRIIAAAKAAGVPAFLERSGGGKGWHVWVFFSTPVPAALARKLGLYLAPTDVACTNGKMADPERGKGIEVFPKQNAIGDDGYGSMVWLPEWSRAPKGANKFYGTKSDLPAQTISQAEVEKLVGAWEPVPSAQLPAATDKSPKSAAPADLQRKLELYCEEPICKAMLAGEVQFGRDAWRFIGDNIAVTCVQHAEPLGPDAPAFALGGELFHKVSKPDTRPKNGYDPKTCDAQWHDSVKRALAAAGDPAATSKLFVTYDALGEHGVPEELLNEGKKLANAPAAWVQRRLGTLTDGSAEVAAFIERAECDREKAITDALGNRELLAAIARLERKNKPAFENFKLQLERFVKPKFVKALVNAAKAIPVPKAAKAAAMTRYPVIQVNDRNLRDVYADAARALLAANAPPTDYLRDGAIVFVKVDQSGAVLADYTEDSFGLRLSQAANWEETTFTMGDEEPRCELVFPHKTVVKAVLNTPPNGLPRVRSVVTTPFFSRNGQLVSDAGYHASDEVILVPDQSLTVPPVSPKPTADEVRAALALLQGECFAEFPFAHDADRAHAIGLVILPFVRQMIDGPTPLHVIEAPEAASGKGLAADVASIIATGHEMRWRAFATKEEKREEAIFTVLRSGCTFAAFDNVRGSVESPMLELALTSTTVATRLFHTQTEGTATNIAIWVFTANNASFNRDMARRSVRSRIDPKMESPEERVFRHDDLRGYLKANRGKLVHAVLTLVQFWVTLGRPKFTARKLASFEDWSQVVGGILEAVGVVGFLDPAASLNSSDIKKDEAREFIMEWARVLKDQPVTARQLLDDICAAPVYDSHTGTDTPPKEPSYLASVLGTGPVGSRVVRLGLWLTNNKERVLAGYRLETRGPDKHASVNLWQLRQMVPKEATPALPVAPVATTPEAPHPDNAEL